MANTITGRIKYISPIQTIVSQKTGKSLVKRELIIDATRIDQFTGERGVENTPKFDVVGERCQELDKFQVGQVVNVTFYLQGREYTDKTGAKQIMNSVSLGGIELRVRTQTQQPQYQQPVQAGGSTYQNPSPQGGYFGQGGLPPYDNNSVPF